MRLNLYIAVFLLSLGLKAQQNQLWFGYYNTVKLNDRFAINSDFQGRTTNWYEEWSQSSGRMGLAFKLNARFTVTAGFADFVFFSKNRLSRNEYRPWEEIALQYQYGKLRVTHRIRGEQRYFRQIVNDEWVDQYSFNHRFRYKLDIQWPLWSPKESDKRVDAQFGNEVMFNAGDVKSYFDQNRISAGILYTLSKHAALQLQYVYILQQSSRATLDGINVIRLNFYHTIYL